MKPHLLLSAVLALWGDSALAAPIAKVTETDVCVYGGTSGGVAAAVQAARMGKSVADGSSGDAMIT